MALSRTIAMTAPAASPHTQRWAKGLADRGYQVVLISNNHRRITLDGIDIHYLPGSTKLSYITNLPRVKRLLKHLRPDIVHAHFVAGYGLWGAAEGRAPFIASVWGSDIEDALAHRATIGLIVRNTLRKARFITASSRFLLDRVRSFDPMLTTRSRVIPIGVDIPDEIPPKPESPDRITIVFAKAYHPFYAPEVALQGFAWAAAKDRRLHLVMLGAGTDSAECRALARQLKIDDRIKLIGAVDHSCALRHIQESDIMIMPSRRESFGVAALEAAAAAVPVIASRIGGIPEVVDDGITGILIDVDDSIALSEAILKISEDAALRSTMGAAAYEMVKARYSSDAALDHMIELYDQALGV